MKHLDGDHTARSAGSARASSGCSGAESARRSSEAGNALRSAGPHAERPRQADEIDTASRSYQRLVAFYGDQPLPEWLNRHSRSCQVEIITPSIRAVQSMSGNGSGENPNKSEPGAAAKWLLPIAVFLLLDVVILSVLLHRRRQRREREDLGPVHLSARRPGGHRLHRGRSALRREVNRKQAEQAERLTEQAAEAKKKGEGLKQAILAHLCRGKNWTGERVGRRRGRSLSRRTVHRVLISLSPDEGRAVWITSAKP